MDWRKRSGRGNWLLLPRELDERLGLSAREQQPSIGCHRGSTELDAKLGIEREANRARCRVTHWMMPSAPARHPRNPHFLRALSDYGLVRSPLKTKMRDNLSESSPMETFTVKATLSHPEH